MIELDSKPQYVQVCFSPKVNLKIGWDFCISVFVSHSLLVKMMYLHSHY